MSRIRYSSVPYPGFNHAPVQSSPSPLPISCPRPRAGAGMAGKHRNTLSRANLGWGLIQYTLVNVERDIETKSPKFRYRSFLSEQNQNV
jgi:hypothetical protein